MAIVSIGASSSTGTASSGGSASTIGAAQSGFSAGGILDAIGKGAGAVVGGVGTVVEKTAEFIKKDEVQNLLKIKRALDTLGGGAGGGGIQPDAVPPAQMPRMDLAAGVTPISTERKGLLAARAPEVDEMEGTRLFHTTPGGPEVFGARSPEFDRTPTTAPPEEDFDFTDAIEAGVRGAGRGALNLAQAGLGQPITTGGGDPTILQRGLGVVSDVVASTLGVTPPAVIAGEADPAPPTGREKFFGGVADISGAIQGHTPQSTLRANAELRRQEGARARRSLELREMAHEMAVMKEARAARGEKREIRSGERAEIEMRRKLRGEHRDTIQAGQTILKGYFEEAERTRDPVVQGEIYDEARNVARGLDPSGGLVDMVDFKEEHAALDLPARYDDLVEVFPELDFILKEKGPEGVAAFLSKETTMKRLLQISDVKLTGGINRKLAAGIEWYETSKDAEIQGIYERLAPGGFSVAEFLEAHEKLPASKQLTPAELDSFTRNPGSYAQIITLEDVTTTIQKSGQHKLTVAQAAMNSRIEISENMLLEAVMSNEDPNDPMASRRKSAIERLLLGANVSNKNVELIFREALTPKFAIGEKAVKAELDRKKALHQKIGLLMPDHLEEKLDSGAEFTDKDVNEVMEFTAKAYGIDLDLVKRVGKTIVGGSTDAAAAITGAVVGPPPLPKDQSELKVGDIYELADGTRRKFTGTGFAKLEDDDTESVIPGDVVTPEEASRIVRGVKHTIQAPGTR